ncbi:MAG: YicC family protein [Clostridia bacterium]|nr:YicC family protein [Clostridia bacterium]
MPNSMTGYAKAQTQHGGMDITVEIRSVNHKGFEYNCRAPRILAFLEDKVKAEVQKRAARGKIDVFLSIELGESENIELRLNRSVLSAYLDMLKTLRDEYGLKDDISVMNVARFSDIFDMKKEDADQSVIWEGVKECLSQALESFIAMRRAEGESLCRDLRERKDRVLSIVAQIEERAPKLEAEYRERFETRMREMLGELPIDEQRILTETAVYADKVTIAEEIVRLKSHMEQFGRMLEAEEPIGRKMNFLSQEMNREANTIVSKVGDVQIVGMIVELKSEIENIREQIQNIE